LVGCEREGETSHELERRLGDVLDCLELCKGSIDTNTRACCRKSRTVALELKQAFRKVNNISRETAFVLTMLIIVTLQPEGTLDEIWLGTA
jgi:hypothetical protein